MRRTHKEKVQDDFILGALMASGSGSWRLQPDGNPSVRSDQTVCAIGAGLVHAATAERESVPVGDSLVVAAARFAGFFGVTDAYAVGVSDGFEGEGKGEIHPTADTSGRDWERGLAVGAALREAVGL